MSAWDLSSIANIYNVLRLKVDGEEIPAIISWQELGRLSSELEIEMADLARSSLDFRAGRYAGCFPRDQAGCSNAEVREQIAAYYRGSDKLPPALYAEINANGEIPVCVIGGKTIFLAVQKPGSFVRYSFARIVIADPNKMRLTIFKRAGGCAAGLKSNDIPTPAELRALGQPIAAGLILPENSKQPAVAVISKSISQWLFHQGPQKYRVVDRTLNKYGEIILAPKDGENYLLIGMRELFKQGVKKVKIALQEEQIEKELVRTARVYDARRFLSENEPGECLALFKLPPDQRKGIRVS